MKNFLTCLLITAASLNATTVVDDLSGLKILTPALHERQTRKLRLDNELEVYLISDPGAQQSAAAIAVEVGSWQDPDDRHGQAHFTEHMLFLGNEAYPQEAGFHRYVDDHGGMTNAYTAEDHTAYLFAINHDALPEGLDRLAHFFINPLFFEGSMGREQHAVDQEFDRAIEHDGRRELMVLKMEGNPDHPFSRFSAGNKATLEDITTADMKGWFDDHYSANLMHLVVYSAKPIDEIQDLVEEHFTAIPNKSYPPFAVPGTRLSKETEGTTFFVEPHQDKRQLTLVWEIPYDYTSDTETAAVDLVGHVLGHEGPGSLLAQLKSEGLAEGLGAGALRTRKPHTVTALFEISVDLTAQGLDQRDLVATRCFQAVARLREEGVPLYMHDEIGALNKLRYQFQTRRAAYEEVTQHIRGLINEPLASYPRLTLVPPKYDQEAVADIVNHLKPATCRLSVMAPAAQLKVRLTKRDPWMGVGYHVAPVAHEKIHDWASVEPHHSITIPTPNPFIPKKLDVGYQGELTETFPTPHRVVDDGFAAIYYAQDQHFGVPEIAWTFCIRSAEVVPGNAETAALVDLLVKSIQERLNPVAYEAQVAGLNFRLEPAEEGITISIIGYSDKAPLLFEQVLQAFTDSIPNEATFDQYRDTLSRTYLNASREEPIVQAANLVRQVLYKDAVTPQEKGRALKKIDHQRYVLFLDAFRNRTYVEAMLFGNMSEKRALALNEMLRKKLQRDPFPAAKRLRPEVINLPTDKAPHYLVKRTKGLGNALVLAIEEGPFSFEKRASQQVLAKGMEEPFFSELRTNQQTGYIVASWERELEQHLFCFFGVQSSCYEPQELLSRFELFIESFVRNFDQTLPEERFNTIKTALVHRLRQTPPNPTDMSALLNTLAFKQHGNFDFLNQRTTALEELTYDQFRQDATEWLSRTNKQRLAIMIEGKTDSDRSLLYNKVRSLQRLKELSTFN